MVVLDYTASAKIPEGATLKVKEIKDNKEQPSSQEKKNYDEYLKKAQNALGQTSTKARKSTKARFFDIQIIDKNNNLIEPAGQVNVKITFDTPENIIDPRDTEIVHFKQDGEQKREDAESRNAVAEAPDPAKAKPEILDATASEKISIEESTVQFKTDSFSVYGVVYTVEFHFDGGEYVIAGGQHVYLSELIKTLELKKNTDGEAFVVGDVESVAFSDTRLVNVEKEGNDWKLTSMGPFTSKETLTIVLKNGAEVTVAVTDAIGMDLTPYIKRDTVYKLVNGQWTPVTMLTDGDAVRVELAYSLPENMITLNNKVAMYEVSSTEYSLQYDAESRKMMLKLPDSRGMVLVYEYELDETFNNGSISNKVNLEGRWSQETKTELVNVESSATATKAKLTVYKVDKDNYKKTLQGAVFSIKRWRDGTKGWAVLNNTPVRTTDENGSITFTLSGSSPDLKRDVLYRMSEDTAPDGYKKDVPFTYIIIKSRNNEGVLETDQEAFKKAQAGDAQNLNKGTADNPSTPLLTISDVKFLENVGGIVYITNEQSHMTVVKKWLDSNGNEISAPADTSIQVQLKRQVVSGTGDDEVYGDLQNIGYPVTLDADNDWRYVWNGADLPIDAGNGNRYAYKVEEISVLQNGKNIKSQYTASYTSTGNDTTGDYEIIVSNKPGVKWEAFDLYFAKVWKNEDGQPESWPVGQKISVKIRRKFTDTNVEDNDFTLKYEIRVSNGKAYFNEITTAVNSKGERSAIEMKETVNPYWFHVTNLDLKSPDGRQYEYYVAEDQAAGYEAPQYTYSGDNTPNTNMQRTSNGGRILNSPILTEVSFTKRWHDLNGDLIAVPADASAAFTVYANGEATDKTVTLNSAHAAATGTWRYTFDKLRKYDSSGKEIVYTVRETKTYANYVPDGEANASNDYTIINQPDVPDTITITVNKIWEDNDGKKISDTELKKGLAEVKFRTARYTDGKSSEDSKDIYDRQEIILNAKDADTHHWTHTWTDLPKASDDGKHTYTYKVKEVYVKYYGDSQDINYPKGDPINGEGLWTVTQKDEDTGTSVNGKVTYHDTTITNKLSGTKVTFSKQWLNVSNKAKTWAVDDGGEEIPITVIMTRYIDGVKDDSFEAVTYKVTSQGLYGDDTAPAYPINLKSGTGNGPFTFEISNLPIYRYDKNSKKVTGTYEYRFTEASMSGYKVRYRDDDSNDVTNEGMIPSGGSITNMELAIELPSTGGSGTTRYIGGGMLLILAALILLYINNKNCIWKEEQG